MTSNVVHLPRGNLSRIVRESIFADTINAMQNAEEIWADGMTDTDYIGLMDSIAAEAIKRRDACAARIQAGR